ncbi:MAG: lysine-2,3-aminomutase-like protein [Pseudomonadota bacterium]
MSKHRKTARSPQDLVDQSVMSASAAAEIEQVAKQYALAVSPAVLDLIRDADPEEGVARQFIPTPDERTASLSELKDPIGDERHSPVPGIIHRYNDRVLFNVVNTCPVYCRFCFRREAVGPGNPGLISEQTDTALDYIRDHPEIWEVIFSGGDPLILSARRLRSLLTRLRAIDHVGIARFHSRVPAVAPDMITEGILQALKSGPTTFVVLHINHPDELSSQACAAIGKIVDAGIPMLSQSVLLRGVNDSAKTLSRLFKALLKNRVKPYYLHHPDMAKGTRHFRPSIEDGRRITNELRRDHSGLCQPHYILEIPGGQGKIPICANHLRLNGGDTYEVTDLEGRHHTYVEDVQEDAT